MTLWSRRCMPHIAHTCICEGLASSQCSLFSFQTLTWFRASVFILLFFVYLTVTSFPFHSEIPDTNRGMRIDNKYCLLQALVDTVTFCSIRFVPHSHEWVGGGWQADKAKGGNEHAPWMRSKCKQLPVLYFRLGGDTPEGDVTWLFP